MNMDLKTELVHTIFQFKRIASTGFGMDIVENKSEINMSELVLMNSISENTIHSNNNVGMSDVRSYLSVSKAAVSQMLSSLEKKNYIQRDIDKNNRRNLIVTLTKEGHLVLERQYEHFSNRLENIISHLGEDDVKQMITIVNRMINITNELDNNSK